MNMTNSNQNQRTSHEQTTMRPPFQTNLIKIYQVHPQPKHKIEDMNPNSNKSDLGEEIKLKARTSTRELSKNRESQNPRATAEASARVDGGRRATEKPVWLACRLATASEGRSDRSVGARHERGGARKQRVT